MADQAAARAGPDHRFPGSAEYNLPAVGGEIAGTLTKRMPDGGGICKLNFLPNRFGAAGKDRRSRPAPRFNNGRRNHHAAAPRVAEAASTGCMQRPLGIFDFEPRIANVMEASLWLALELSPQQTH